MSTEQQSGQNRANSEGRWYPKYLVFFAAFCMLSLLFLHTYLLAENVQIQSKMEDAIKHNNRTYTLLRTVLAAAESLPTEQLPSFSDFKNYKLKLGGYNVDISLSKKPKWPVLMSGTINAQEINKLVKQNDNHVEISYLMKDHEWINYAETRHFSTYRVTAMLFISELIVISLFLLFGWSLYRLKIPLTRFKRTAEKLGTDFKVQLEEESGPEIVRETARAMKAMQQRIQELVENRTRLLATISHDLKTPITRLQLRAQFIDDEDIAQKIIQDLNEMQQMIDGVLSFARNDVYSENKIKFDLVSLLYTICDDFNDIGTQVKVKSTVKSSIINGRKIALKRCFSNIIQNASKYATDISVTINQVKDRIRITIVDNGPGIAENELAHVFKAFFRSSSSKYKSSTGTGLGLTIAEEVISDHRGSIILTNIKPHGLKVTIELPIDVTT